MEQGTTTNNNINRNLRQNPELNKEIARKTLYIGNLNSFINEDNFIRFFGLCGPIVQVCLSGDNSDRYRSRFGFVEYKDYNSVLLAKQLNKYNLAGCSLHIGDSKGPINSPSAYGSAYEVCIKEDPLITSIYVPTLLYKNLSNAIKNIEQKYDIVCGDISSTDSIHSDKPPIFKSDLSRVPTSLDMKRIDAIGDDIDHICQQLLDARNSSSQSINKSKYKYRSSSPNSRYNHEYSHSYTSSKYNDMESKSIGRTRDRSPNESRYRGSSSNIDDDKNSYYSKSYSQRNSYYKK